MNDQVVNFFAGVIAGSISKTIVAPLDRLRTLRQLYPDEPWLTRQGSVYKCLTCPFKGNLISVFRAIPSSGFYFGFYSLFRKVSGLSEMQSVIFSSSMAAFLSTSLTYPLDTIHTRVLDSKKFRQALNQGNLYKGYLISVSYVVPYSIISMSIYESWKDETSPFIAGASAGIFTHSLLYPFETMKKLVQTSNFKNINVRILYRGIGLILIRTPLLNGINMHIIEKFKKWCKC